MSTLRMCWGLALGPVLCSRNLFSLFSPFLVPRLHVSVRSCTSFSPDSVSVITIILSEFRILHIVEVDSETWPIKIFFPNILLINVDFPALVSPVRKTTVSPLRNYRHLCYWYRLFFLARYAVIKKIRHNIFNQVDIDTLTDECKEIHSLKHLIVCYYIALRKKCINFGTSSTHTLIKTMMKERWDCLY